MQIDLVLVVAGVSIIAFRKPFSKYTVDFQNKNFGYKFGERETKGAEIGCIVVGIFAIVLALTRIYGNL